MKKITMMELDNVMMKFNTDFPEKSGIPCLPGVIVYKTKNWKTPYTEEQRSYRVYNNNNRFDHWTVSNSLYGSRLDYTDNSVRLDLYQWEIDYCYLEDEV